MGNNHYVNLSQCHVIRTLLHTVPGYEQN